MTKKKLPPNVNLTSFSKHRSPLPVLKQVIERLILIAGHNPRNAVPRPLVHRVLIRSWSALFRHPVEQLWNNCKRSTDNNSFRDGAKGLDSPTQSPAPCQSPGGGRPHPPQPAGRHHLATGWHTEPNYQDYPFYVRKKAYICSAKTIKITTICKRFSIS